MKWVSHLAIAGSIAAVFNPLLVPVALAGSIAPDWMEGLLKKMGRQHVKHRGETHVLMFWLFGVAFAFFLWDFHGILF